MYVGSASGHEYFMAPGNVRTFQPLNLPLICVSWPPSNTPERQPRLDVTQPGYPGCSRKSGNPMTAIQAERSRGERVVVGGA